MNKQNSVAQKKTLGLQAYEPLPEDKTYDPFIPPVESPAEFTPDSESDALRSPAK